MTLTTIQWLLICTGWVMVAGRLIVCATVMSICILMKSPGKPSHLGAFASDDTPARNSALRGAVLIRG